MLHFPKPYQQFLSLKACSGEKGQAPPTLWHHYSNKHFLKVTPQKGAFPFAAIFFLSKKNENSSFRGNRTKLFQNFTRESESFLGTTAAPQTGQQKRQKVNFSEQCKRLPKTDTETERQILGEVRGPGSAERALKSQKPQVQVLLQIQELPGDFGSMDLSSAVLDVEVSLGRVPGARDLQGPSGDCRVQALIQGLEF